jgi:hypothetical protein
MLRNHLNGGFQGVAVHRKTIRVMALAWQSSEDIQLGGCSEPAELGIDNLEQGFGHCTHGTTDDLGNPPRPSVRLEDLELTAFITVKSCDQARALLESGTFNKSKPGPYRILGVYPVPSPSASAHTGIAHRRRGSGPRGGRREP